MENEYGGIRVYNFDVERFKAGQKSVVFPTAPAGFTYPSQNPDGSGPADFEGHSGNPGEVEQVRAARGRGVRPDRARAARRSARATAWPTT